MSLGKNHYLSLVNPTIIIGIMIKRIKTKSEIL